MKYKSRKDATQFLRDQGVVVSDSTLQQLASEDRGPRFSIINGRALYTDADLRGWIKAEVDTERPKRVRRADRATAL